MDSANISPLVICRLINLTQNILLLISFIYIIKISPWLILIHLRHLRLLLWHHFHLLHTTLGPHLGLPQIVRIKITFISLTIAFLLIIIYTDFHWNYLIFNQRSQELLDRWLNLQRISLQKSFIFIPRPRQILLHHTNIRKYISILTILYHRKYRIIHHLHQNTILPEHLTLLQGQNHNPRMLNCL